MSENPLGTGVSSDKYRTLFELGHGGTANVALAVAKGPEGFKKLFVVKSLRAAYAQDPEFRAMFMNEARLSARLNHPNVVQVYEVFEQDGTPTLLMEYIEGQTLDAVLCLPQPKLPLDLHLRVLADVLSGLHYSHELLDLKHAPLHVVHRDVSPHNVMLSYEGVVKVLDFGIAKLSGSAVETEIGVIKGKLRYMLPEQIAGEDVDRRADVFAVGVMLWEALSGTRLWKGLADATIMNRVLHGEIPPPKHETAAIPPELLAICARALAVDREQRFSTALELELAIDEYLAKKSHCVSAREVGRFMAERFAAARQEIDARVGRMLGQGESVAPSPEPLPLPAPTASRTGYTASRATAATADTQRSQLRLGAVVLLALGAAIVFMGLRRASSEPPGAVILQPSPASPASSVARRVRIAIEARPENATVSIDGVVVTNPYSADHDWDAERHRIRVDAPGFVSEETEVRFDADVRMMRSLGPGPVSSALPRTSPRLVARPAASVSGSPPQPRPDCDPSYVLDARGIKRFKPECL